MSRSQVSQAQPCASFADWLDGRRPVHLSTNAGAEEIAFQGWRNFKEGFAPELIAQAVNETSEVLGRNLKNCIDPFGGSGTTALACQFLGITPTTIEVNPYLADLIEAKLTKYNVDSLIRDFKRISNPRNLKISEPFPGAPKTFVAPGLDKNFLFTKAIAIRLATLRTRILKIRNPKNRRFFRVLLGAIALPVSNVVVSGKGRRYRKNWKTTRRSPAEVDRLFTSAVLKAIYEIKRFHIRSVAEYKLIRGDSRKVIPNGEKFDLAIFSPPYPNSFDYTDVYNVELWVCGYLTSPDSNRALRNKTLASHVQVKREFGKPLTRLETLSITVSRLQKARKKLWNKNIPAMVEGYFADMEAILQKLGEQLQLNGQIYMVVGDSKYAGIHIPVAKILAELSNELGFSVVRQEPFRSMRVSPQQGGNTELAETLLILRLEERSVSHFETQKYYETDTISKGGHSHPLLAELRV